MHDSTQKCLLACSVNFCQVVLSWDHDLDVAAVGVVGVAGPGAGAGAGAGVGGVVAVVAVEIVVTAVVSQRPVEHSRDSGSLLGGLVQVGSGTSIHEEMVTHYSLCVCLAV